MRSIANTLWNAVIPRKIERGSLRWKLTLGFAAVIGLTTCVGIIAVFSQIYARNIVSNLLDKNVRIADLTLQSDVAMLNGWRYEKELLVHHQVLGFDEIKNRYLMLVHRLESNINDNMDRIRELTISSGIILDTQAVNQAMGLSKDAFLTIIDLLDQRIRPDAGLVDQLHQKSAEIEVALGTSGLEALKLDSMTIDSREKTYLLRGLDKEADDVREAVTRFKADIASSGVDSSKKLTLQTAADGYAALFQQLAVVDGRIAVATETYIASKHKVEIVLDKLHDDAVLDESEARGQMDRSVVATLWTTLGAGVSAAGLGLIVALFVSRRITGGVGECLNFAQRVAEGDLDARLEGLKQDEFGALANGLNRMAERLAETNAVKLREVAGRERAQTALRRANEELELRVLDRTHELSAQNEKLEGEITWRTQATEELDRIFTLAEDIISTAGLDGYYKRVNPAFERLLGYSSMELLAEPLVSFVHSDDREAISTAVRHAFGGEKTLGAEGRWRCKDGTYKWIQWNAVAVPSEQLIYATGRDVTQMKRAEDELEQKNKQLMGISHQAGMAEVATSVLHNVGNVLNSLSVSSALISEWVRESKVVNLSKVVALMSEHTNDLGTFLTNDPKGKQVPGYLCQLAEHMVNEQPIVVDEVALLCQNIEHIKEIILMQQSYAKISGFVETAKVSDLVEDALRMNVGSLLRHEVEVRREFDDVPPINTEKHKVLQILVNLMRNAKHACNESGREDKLMTLRIAMCVDQVRISVLDNGIGIPPKNLTRIFNHGFTTRKDGHGFGLHSAVLAAVELGGSLSAHSDGLGHGAIFTLELPLKPSGNN